MQNNERVFTTEQLLFKQIVVGSLIYAVVLGFFDDYTPIVEARSFSSIFLASIVLQALTQLAFLLKKQIITWLKNKQGFIYTIMMFVCVWLVMFVSKFVFVWVIDSIFGNNMNIYGFFGILAVVLSVTVLHKLADLTFIKLGATKRD